MTTLGADSNYVRRVTLPQGRSVQDSTISVAGGFHVDTASLAVSAMRYPRQKVYPFKNRKSPLDVYSLVAADFSRARTILLVIEEIG